MKLSTASRSLVSGLAGVVLASSAPSASASAVLDAADLAALLGVSDPDLTGVYAQASSESLDLVTFEFLADTPPASSSATTVDATSSAPITLATASSSAGADFPADSSGVGGAARAESSGSATTSALVDATGTGFFLGDFVASGGAGPFTVTFDFDVSALLTFVDSSTETGELLTTGISTFALLFDADDQDFFEAQFSIDSDIFGDGMGSNVVRLGAWDDATFDGDFAEDTTEDPLSDCAANDTTHRCTYSVDSSASVSLEVENGDTFSLMFGVQSFILGSGDDFSLLADAARTTTLASVTLNDPGASITLQQSPITEAPEPASLALLAIGLLGVGAAARRRRPVASPTR